VWWSEQRRSLCAPVVSSIDFLVWPWHRPWYVRRHFDPDALTNIQYHDKFWIWPGYLSLFVGTDISHASNVFSFCLSFLRWKIDFITVLMPEHIEFRLSYFFWPIYFSYSSWESQYHKTLKLSRISCKSITFVFNLEMYSTDREKEAHSCCCSELHTFSSTFITKPQEVSTYFCLNS